VRDHIVKQIEGVESSFKIHELREYLQRYSLAALYETGGFDSVAFVGGTCLRLYHGTQRYSEDMDFSLMDGRSLEGEQVASMMKSVLGIVAQWGIEVNGKLRHKGAIASASFKFPGLLKEIGQSSMSSENLMIKFDFDLNPPEGANYTNETSMMPMMNIVRTHDISSLMSGKLHAILARSWCKGRDWYDLLWYLGSGVNPNLNLLSNALDQIPSPYCADVEKWREACVEKAYDTDWNKVVGDVERFIVNKRELELITADHFAELLEAPPKESRGIKP